MSTIMVTLVPLPTDVRRQKRRRRKIQRRQFTSIVHNYYVLSVALLLLINCPYAIQCLQLLYNSDGDTMMTRCVMNTISNNSTYQYSSTTDGTLSSNRKAKRCRLKNILTIINSSEREIMLMTLAKTTTTTKNEILPPPVPQQQQQQSNTVFQRSTLFERAITCRGGSIYSENTQYYNNPTSVSVSQQEHLIDNTDNISYVMQNQQQQKQYNRTEYNTDEMYSHYHETDDVSIDEEFDYDEDEIDYYDDDECDDDNCSDEYYDSASIESKSSSSSTTMFHPPAIKLNDMVSALLYTCNMNERLQNLVEETKRHQQRAATVITYEQSIQKEMYPTHLLYQQEQQESLQSSYYNNNHNHLHTGNTFERTSSKSFCMPIASTATNPQGSLRGGGTATLARTAAPYTYEDSRYDLSHQQPQQSPTPMTNYNYHHHNHQWGQMYKNYNHQYKVPLKIRNISIANSQLARTADKCIWYTEPSSTTRITQEQFTDYLQTMIRDVLEIPLANNDKQRSNADMLQQQLSSLELTLAIIYLDRACSVNTPRSRPNNHEQQPYQQRLQHGQHTICPPCTSSTMNGLVLASLLLSVSSVRGISVEEIVGNKYLQLSKLLKSSSINIANRIQHPTPCNQSHDDVMTLQHNLKEMVRIMKDSLGDSGIFVSKDEMKQFRQSWEHCFGPSIV